MNDDKPSQTSDLIRVFVDLYGLEFVVNDLFSSHEYASDAVQILQEIYNARPIANILIKCHIKR